MIWVLAALLITLIPLTQWIIMRRAEQRLQRQLEKWWTGRDER